MLHLGIVIGGKVDLKGILATSSEPIDLPVACRAGQRRGRNPCEAGVVEWMQLLHGRRYSQWRFQCCISCVDLSRGNSPSPSW